MAASAAPPTNHTIAPLPSVEPARAVFEEARRLVQLQEPRNILLHEWLRDKYTIDDVFETVAVVQKSYSSRPRSRARKWLSEFSAGVATYGNILDVLVQQNPEYVSLIWGTTKFLFVLVQNHEEVLTELAKSLSKISALLPCVKIHANLFPIPAMRNAVMEVYSTLIAHLHETLKFYQTGRIKKAWRAFIKPYALKFKDHVEKIDLYSRVIESLAQALAHQEGHQTHDRVRDLQAQVQNLERILYSWHDQDYTLMQTIHSRVGAHLRLTEAHFLVTEDMRTGQMIEAAKSDVFRDPMEVLSFRQSFTRRHQAACRMNLGHIWRSSSLKRWSLCTGSSMLLVSGCLPLRKENIILGTDMIRFLRKAGVTVLWALQSVSASSDRVKTSPEQVVQYLTLQAIKAISDTLGRAVSADFNHTKVSAASTLEQWVQLLAFALASLPLVYILVDLDVLETVSDGSIAIADLCNNLHRLTKDCSKTVVKMALISFRKTGLPYLDHCIDESLDMKGSATNRRRNRPQTTQSSRMPHHATTAFRNRVVTKI